MLNNIFNPNFTVKDIDCKVQAKQEKKDIQRLAKLFIEDHSERNFNALMKRCSWGLRNYIFSMTGNNYDTDNILSITMEHIYFGIDSFNGDIGKFSTWIYRIAHNDTVTYFRVGGYKSKINVTDIDLSDIHERVICHESNDMLSDIDEEIENMSFNGKEFTTYTKSKVICDMYDASVDCMDDLPDNLKIVMKERYINKKKINSIAKDNNMSPYSVKNWIRKGCSELAIDVRNKHKELYEIFNEMKND